MRRTLHVLRLALLAAALATPALAQKGVHKDPRIGFELKPPKDWVQIPLADGEEWIVAKYQSPKDDRAYDKDSQSSWTLRPELLVIAFLDEAIKRADVEEDEDEGERKEVRVRVTYPFRNYQEFLEKTMSGFYIQEDETTKAAGLPARKLVVRAEGGGGAPVRFEAWVFTTELGEVAVQLDCFEASYDEYKSLIDRTLKSFKTIPRTADLDIRGRTGGFVSLVLVDLDPAERKLRRQEAERDEWMRLSGGLPSGWSAKEIQGVNVLNHSDEAFAKKCVERVNAVRRWLDDTFPQIGQGEYTRTPIMRICESREEERSFLRGTGLRSGTEIVTHKDTTFGATSGEWTYISERTLQMWFFDRDFDLWINLPAWLSVGMSRAVGFADVKGKSLDFGTDYFKRWLRDIEGEPMPARSLLDMTGERLYEDQSAGNSRSTVQSMALVRFLVDGRSKKYRQVLPDYLAHVSALVAEMKAERKDAPKAEKPKSEEEEEAYFEQKKSRAKEQEQHVLQEALRRTFGSWSEADWAAFERDYRASID